MFAASAGPAQQGRRVCLSDEKTEIALFFIGFAIRCDSVYHGARSLGRGFHDGSPYRNGSICHCVHRTAGARQANQQG